jgi:hypothetical protein
MFRTHSSALSFALAATALTLTGPALADGPYVTLHDDGTIAKQPLQTFDDLTVIRKKVLALYDATGTPRPQILSVWSDFPIGGSVVSTTFDPIANDAQGIGLDVARSTAPPLRAMMLHNDVTRLDARAKVQNAPSEGFARYLFLLELSHVWGPAISLPTGDGGAASADELIGFSDHWSFWMDAEGSPAGGNRWQANGDGTFTVLPQSPSTVGYSMLDLYLMGLAGPEEVQPFGVLENAVPPAGVTDPFTHRAYSATSFPWFASSPFTVTATRRTIDIQEVIAANGGRVPSSGNAPHSWTLGIVLLVGASDSDGTVARVQTTFDPIATSLAPAFHEATHGRGTLDVLTAPPPDPGAQGDDGGSVPEEDAGSAPAAFADAPAATTESASCSTHARGARGQAWLAMLGFATMALSRRRSSLVVSSAARRSSRASAR